MNPIHIQYWKTPYGEFILGSFDQQLCLMDFRYRRMRSTLDRRIKTGLSAEYVEKDDALLKETRAQLSGYFEGKRQTFDLPLLTVGSPFQKQVWDALRRIPFGKTCSYLDLAKNIDNQKAVRAVASANGANAISILIPCHRVIGSDGALVGYAGGLPLKKRLLKLECGQEATH